MLLKLPWRLLVHVLRLLVRHGVYGTGTYRERERFWAFKMEETVQEQGSRGSLRMGMDMARWHILGV